MRSVLKSPIALITVFFIACFATPAPAADLANISSRVFCETGDAVVLTEFIIQGSESKSVVLRALGPSLAALGVPQPLRDPRIQLFDARGNLLDSNDNWMDNPDKDAIIATGLEPPDDREPAIIDTLAQGIYTAVVRGKHNGQGTTISELYDVSFDASQLSALGARGAVLTGEDVLTSGVIISGSAPLSLLVRALGPSLTAAGISGALPDPFLELYDANGNLIFFNDNWKDTQEAEILATGLAPSDDAESALVVDINPGAYTAVGGGIASTTGIGFVQFYSLETRIRELNPAPIIRPGH